MEGELVDPDVAELTTEARNPLTRHLDTWDTASILTAMNREDRGVAEAVGRELPAIARAVDLVVAARRAGGRLVYLGAGTSGRIGVLDAVECPPTFGTAPEEVVGLIAGGEVAVTGAVEGAEDDDALAAVDLDALGVGSGDVVVGLAASGRTPYVVAGLVHARARGAATVAVSCNAGARTSRVADVAIEVVTGPEVLTGSTRLKAGTATKLVCNMISTSAMVMTGKAYENLMVDVRPTNAKLLDRARRIVSAATGQGEERATASLAASGSNAKTAIVMLELDCDAPRARELLAAADGDVRRAVGAALSSPEGA